MAGEKDTFKAACCVGRQPDCKVWVLNERVQRNQSGEIMEKEDQQILWVSAVFELEDGRRKTEQSCPMPNIDLPLYSLALKDVLISLQETIHDNFMAGVFTVGKW